tara:strand:+ start:35 stop:613 length:579 start_codon:yes stop_codon:yes gene_type:complete
MKPNKIKISKIKSNPNNPRVIKDYKFKKLMNSIVDFPDMLKLRPIIVDENNIILGGNMRYKACLELGHKDVWAVMADDLTEEQKKQFVIKDNVGFGEWDWDLLANDWETKELKDWGIDVWQPEEAVDYSVLDEVDLDSEIDNMYEQTKKSIILEFPTEKYINGVQQVYESLKKKEADLSDIFYKAMLNADKK